MSTDNSVTRYDTYDSAQEIGGNTGPESITIDCDRCVVRGPAACGDCVVTVLLGGPPEGFEIDPVEKEAIDALASCGLVPPLRLVTALGADAATAQ